MRSRVERASTVADRSLADTLLQVRRLSRDGNTKHNIEATPGSLAAIFVLRLQCVCLLCRWRYFIRYFGPLEFNRISLDFHHQRCGGRLVCYRDDRLPCCRSSFKRQEMRFHHQPPNEQRQL